MPDKRLNQIALPKVKPHIRLLPLRSDQVNHGFAGHAKVSINFKNCLKNLSAIQIEPSQLDSINGLFHELEIKFKKIKLLRDNVYAHSNIRDPGEHFRQASISGDYLRDFIAESSRLFNLIEVTYNCSPMDWPDDNYVDLRRLLDCLKK